MSSDGTPDEKEKTDSEEGNEEAVQKDVAAPVEGLVAAVPPAAREVPAHLQKQPVREIQKELLTCTDVVERFVVSSSLLTFSSFLQIPEEFDIDSENSEDCYMCPEYAKEIFDYLKQREVSQTKTLLPNSKSSLNIFTRICSHCSPSVT